MSSSDFSARSLSSGIFDYFNKLNEGWLSVVAEDSRGMIADIDGLAYKLPNQGNFNLAGTYKDFSKPLKLERVAGPLEDDLFPVWSDSFARNTNTLRLSGPEIFGRTVLRADALDALASRARLGSSDVDVLEDVADVDRELMRNLRAAYYGYAQKVERAFLDGGLRLGAFGRSVSDEPKGLSLFEMFDRLYGDKPAGQFSELPDTLVLRVPAGVRPGRIAGLISGSPTGVLEPSGALVNKAIFLACRADLSKAGELKALVAANENLKASAHQAYGFVTELTKAAVEANSSGSRRLRGLVSSLRHLDLSRYGGVLLGLGLMAFSLNAEASEGNEVEASKPTEGDLAALVQNPVARGFFSLAFPNLDLALSLVA